MSVPTSTPHRLAAAGLALPPVIFGTSALGNLYRALEPAARCDVVAACVRAHTAAGWPVVLDTAGKYGAGLALEELARCLSRLGVPPEEVVISNKLGWRRVPLRTSEPTFEPGVWIGLEHDAEQTISGPGITACYHQGCELLGDYRPQLVSVHDPDEYLTAAVDAADAERRWDQVLEAYAALFALRDRGLVRGVGVGAKDHRVIARLVDAVDLDWVMLACSLTLHRHPPEVLELVATLRHRGVTIVNSAVFNGGFLTGGDCYDYREVRRDDLMHAPLFAWRDRFEGVCRDFAVDPAAACVRFGLDVAGVAAVALNTSRPERAATNLALATAEIPAAFWQALRRERLIAIAGPAS